MLIAQGTNQVVAGDTTVVNSSPPPIAIETNVPAPPYELAALMSTTALVVSHSDNCEYSFHDLESANADADGSEQETNF